ncbi:MAG: GxxExxY protein [Ignavibacteriae bacterium]|nr:GxxExxY protein [Ignavibacteriota bacterium]
MAKLIYPEESYAIIGACFNVYKSMGRGFLEPVYQECLEIEFDLQKIPFQSQHMLKLAYRDKELKQTFKPDLLCYDKIIVEIKAVSTLVDEHRAQILNYLNATKFQLGLLINFGHYPKLQYERFILTDKGARLQPIK